MIALRSALALALALGAQAALGRVWPAGTPWVDFLLVPVAWYGIAHGQRTAMLVGCAGGLFQDAWFGATGFGINGFKKTLVGWLLGGLGARFDLNSTPGRFALGALAKLGDAMCDPLLRRMLDLAPAGPPPLTLAFECLISGSIVAVAGAVLGRWRQGRSRRHPR